LLTYLFREKLVTDLERKITQIQSDNANVVNELKKLKVFFELEK